jgi:hypothetical protein
MFKVVLIQDMFYNEKEGADFARFEKEIELPFAPFPDLMLETLGPIEEVQWCDGVFVCTFIVRNYLHKEPFCDSTKHFLATGWSSDQGMRETVLGIYK